MANLHQIRSVLEPIYVEAFGADTARHLNVDVAPDHDGDESLFLSAPIDAAKSDKLYGDSYSMFSRKVIEALHSIDERRFPYIRFKFDELDPNLENQIAKRMVRRQ